MKAREQRIRELEKALEYANLIIFSLNHLINFAEKELQVPIRKIGWYQTVKLVKEKKLVKMNVGRLCKLFGKSRQAFYARQSFYNEKFYVNQIMLELVAQIRKDLPGLGTKKLYRVLREPFKTYAINMGRDKLHELFTKQGMLIRRRK